MFNWFCQFSDDIELIHDSAGTEKTLLLTIFMSAYCKLKAHIIIIVSLNLAADTLLQQLIIIDSESKPVCIYWDIFENEELCCLTQSLVINSEAVHVAVEISIIYWIKTKQCLKAFSLPEHLLTQTVMKCVTDVLNDSVEYVWMSESYL